MTAPHRIGWIVAGTLVSGLLGALALTVIAFGGATENVITGVALLQFGASWGVLAVASARWTDQPQRWARVPAMTFTAIGGLFVAWPGIVTVDAAVWVVSLVMLALVVWMWRAAKTQLQSRSRRWMLNPLFAGIAMASVAACVEIVLEHGDQTAIAMHGQLVNVGSYRLHLECSGTGSPAVVLIGGAGELSSAWGWVAPAVARDTRVCVYDRAGRGWSDQGNGPQDGVALAHDLHALLERANVAEPVVLVGHSFGGLYTRVYAAEYPSQVAGMVLLDATHPEMFTKIATYPAFYEGYRRVAALFPTLARFGVGRLAYHSSFDNRPAATRAEQQALWSTAALARNQRDEWREAPVAMKQAGAATSLGARPLAVVTATVDTQAGWWSLQDQLAGLSSNSSHRIAQGAKHADLVDTKAGAAISTQAIRDVVAAVRTAQPVVQQ